MNPNQLSCTASLSGWIEGETWTRWRCAGEGQVRFWLRPVRESLGLLLCAVPVRTACELRAAQTRLAPGRHIELVAEPVAADKSDGPRDEALSRVVFLAVESSVTALDLTGLLPVASTTSAVHGHRITGKMAAAGEHEEDAP